MKKLLKGIIGLSLVLGLTSCENEDKNYEGQYLASGITVSIVDGGINITNASGVLNSDKEILTVKMDSILVPFYGMSATSKPERPASLAILDADNYAGNDGREQFVKDAGDKLVLSKKVLGNSYSLNKTQIDSDASFEYKSWASQISRIEKYLVGKNYSTFLANVCRNSSGGKCKNTNSNLEDVPNGALLDFYGYDAVIGSTISLFDNKYETLGTSLIEMFNSKFKKVTLTNLEEVTSSLDYEVTFNKNILKVTFKNTINDGEQVITDYVEIPLKLASNQITYTNTKSFIKIDTDKKGTNGAIDISKFEQDLVVSSYEK